MSLLTLPESAPPEEEVAATPLVDDLLDDTLADDEPGASLLFAPHDAPRKRRAAGGWAGFRLVWSGQEAARHRAKAAAPSGVARVTRRGQAATGAGLAAMRAAATAALPQRTRSGARPENDTAQESGDAPVLESLLFAPARPLPAARPRRRGRARRAFAPPAYLPMILLIGSAGILGWTFALRPARPLDYALFWSALGCCLCAVLLYGCHQGARARHHLLGLAAFGIVTWLPSYLRNPTQPIFSDELFHLQILQQIAEAGHTHVPVTYYPIPGEFPGLEFAALGLAGATGLPLLWAARLLTLALHALIPGLAYLAARGLGLGRRGALIAALIYAANTSYYYFHAVFSYETLGVAFVLTFWALLSRQYTSAARRDLGLAVPILAAVAVTHHFSSYLLAGTLIVAWLARLAAGRFLRRAGHATGRGRTSIGTYALLAVAFPIGWIAIGTTRTINYLSTSFAARVTSIVSTLHNIMARETGSRQLFAGSSLPLVERAVDFFYVPLLLSLALCGLALILWRIGLRRAPILSLALAPCGPVGWLLTLPAIFTPASELAYRAWPFLFLGLALYAAVTLVLLVGWLIERPRLRPAAWPAVATILAILLFGGISIGDNQGGRFPQAEATKAGGPETITPDLVRSAVWLEGHAGRYNLVAGDGTTMLVMATVGFQRATQWGAWVPFYATTPSEVSQYLAGTDTRFVAVDRRITTLPPRYGFYFGDQELYLPEAQRSGRDPSTPLPVAALAKFDRVQDLDRVYDNGNIQLYERHLIPLTTEGTR